MIIKRDKNKDRLVRHKRVRNKIFGTTECPRLCVYRSLNGIYAQIINDEKSTTLVSASTLDKNLESALKGLSKSQQAAVIGKEIAEKAKKAKVENVVFDRGGYLYTGRVKALADSAREAGLKF